MTRLGFSDRGDSLKSIDEMRVQKARKFARSFMPSQDEGYDWVHIYSKDLFDHRRRILKELDDKSGEIIKYLGGRTGIFTLGVLASVNEKNASIVLWAIPSFLAAIVSVGFATFARKPTAIASPPSITKAIEYVEDGAGDAQTRFLGVWHLSCEQMRCVTRVKGDLVGVATWLYLTAIALLVLPVAATILKNFR